MNSHSDRAIAVRAEHPVAREARGRWAGISMSLSRFRASKLGMVGALIVLAVATLAILGPYVAPYDPLEPNIYASLEGPSGRHLLGTDALGRDTLSRIIVGSRVALQVGIIAVAIAASVGVSMGLLSAYARGWVDNVTMRVVDAMLSFPSLILALAIAAALGPSLRNVMIAVGIALTPSFARLVRSQALVVRGYDYVLAAEAVGASMRRVVVRHILPNVMHIIIVQATLDIGFAILAEAGLSFLGVGIQPPRPAWGSMLALAQPYLYRAPMMAFAPGLAIFFTALAFNFVGDAARDALDPRLRGMRSQA